MISDHIDLVRQKDLDLDDERIEFPEKYILPPSDVSLFSSVKMAARTPRRNDQKGYVVLNGTPVSKMLVDVVWKYSNVNTVDCINIPPRLSEVLV